MLPDATCRPSSQLKANATKPAMMHTITTTPRSCWDRNIASALASVPATIASTGTAPLAWMDRRSEARRSSRTMTMPARPTAPVQPAAISTIWIWSLMTGFASQR